jgi:hypothetical protein
MSKVLDELKALERQRRDGSVADSAEPTSLDAERDAAAAALTRAGADERGRRDADQRSSTDHELLAAMQRRLAAEELATLQAQKRGKAEAEAETVAAQRAHTERLLEMAARTRVEAEERALADAKRREFAAAELAQAAQTRLQREKQAEALARERAEADRNAANLAHEKMIAEQAMEATLLARAAAERDAAQQVERRKMMERAADEAEDGRVSVAPSQINGDQSIEVVWKPKRVVAQQEMNALQKAPGSPMVVGAAAVVGVLLGFFVALFLNPLNERTETRGAVAKGSISNTSKPLRLEPTLRAAPQSKGNQTSGVISPVR